MQVEDSQFLLMINLDQQCFKSTLTERSSIGQFLGQAQFGMFDGFQINIKANEQVDDICYDKIRLLFESPTVANSSIKKIIINSEVNNFFSPKTYKHLLQPFSKSLEELQIYISDPIGIQYGEWLKTFVQIITQKQFKTIFIDVNKLFLINLNNKELIIKINSSLQFNEDGMSLLGIIANSQQFNSFKLVIGDDNRITNSLKYLEQAIIKQELEQFTIKIGSSCQLQSESLEKIIAIISKSQILKKLTINIGSSNQVDSSIFNYIFQCLSQKLTKLKFVIGNSVKLFSKPLQFNKLIHHQLQTLVFRIGKMNNFQCQGASILAYLINSNNLNSINIRIGDFNKMSEQQSLQIFLILQRLRTIQHLELQFERDISINQTCIEQLSQILKLNKNLSQFSLSLAKQQQSLNFQNIFSNLYNRQQLVLLDLNFGGSQSLPRLSQFGEAVSQLNCLNIFKMHLKGNNSIDYQDLTQFLKFVNNNKQLTLFSFKNGQQMNNSQQQIEIQENVNVVSIISQIGQYKIMQYSFLNDDVLFSYNFNSLTFKGELNQNIISAIKSFPIPQNQLVFNVNNLTNQNNNSKRFIDNIHKLIQNQSNIIIKSEEAGFFFIRNELLANLVINDEQMLFYFLANNNLNINYIKYDLELNPQATLGSIQELVLKQNKAADCLSQFHYNFGQFQIELSNNHLFFSMNLSAENPDIFRQYWYIISQICYKKINSFEIFISVSSGNDDWKLMYDSLSQFTSVTYLNLRIFNQNPIQFSLEKYSEFYFYINQLIAFYPTLYNFPLISLKTLHQQDCIGRYINEIKQLQNRINGVPNQQNQQAQMLFEDEDEEEEEEQQQQQQQQQEQLNVEQREELTQQLNNKQIQLELAQKLTKLLRNTIERRQKLLWQYQIIKKQYGSRGYKTIMYSDILDMLI